MVARVSAFLTIVALIFGAYFFLENRYAKCEENKATKEYAQTVERRLDIKIEGDILNQKTARLWALQDRYGNDPKDKLIAQTIKDMQADVDAQKAKVQRLEKKSQ